MYGNIPHFPIYWKVVLDEIDSLIGIVLKKYVQKI